MLTAIILNFLGIRFWVHGYSKEPKPDQTTMAVGIICWLLAGFLWVAVGAWPSCLICLAVAGIWTKWWFDSKNDA